MGGKHPGCSQSGQKRTIATTHGQTADKKIFFDISSSLGKAGPTNPSYHMDIRQSILKTGRTQNESEGVHFS
jgi:hypothetical protein